MNCLEESTKLYCKLKKEKKQHCCVLKNQMLDLQKMENEYKEVDIQRDTKEHLVYCAVTKMNTLRKCER